MLLIVFLLWNNQPPAHDCQITQICSFRRDFHEVHSMVLTVYSVYSSGVDAVPRDPRIPIDKSPGPACHLYSYWFLVSRFLVARIPYHRGWWSRNCWLCDKLLFCTCCFSFLFRETHTCLPRLKLPCRSGFRRPVVDAPYTYLQVYQRNRLLTKMIMILTCGYSFIYRPIQVQAQNLWQFLTTATDHHH